MLWRETLAGIEPALIQEVERRAMRRLVPRRTILYSEGELPDGVYFVEEGRALVAATTVDKAPVALHLAVPGEVLGVLSITQRSAKRMETVTSVTDMQVLVLRLTDVERVRSEFPMIDRFFVDLLVARVDDMTARLAEAVHSTADDRVRARVRDLAEAYDGNIRMSQEALAELSGTTRPTVNRVLRSMEIDGVIKLYRSRVEILEPTSI